MLVDLLTLITVCTVAPTDITEYLYKIARLHDGDPHVVEVVDKGQIFYPDDSDEATRLARRLITEGHSIRVGLALVDPEEAASQYDVSLSELFADHCVHFEIAADQISRHIASESNLPSALTTYYDSPDPHLATSWLRDVLSQPPPSSEDGPYALGRRYHLPDNRMFADVEANNEASPSQTNNPTYRLFDEEPSADTENNENDQRQDGSDNSSLEPDATRAAPSQQPRVTDETLPVSESDPKQTIEGDE